MVFGKDARLALAALTFVVASPGVRASLGGDLQSIETDRIRMQAGSATAAPAPNGGHFVYTTTLPTGTEVRQYLSAKGVVFAVAWSGPFKPDLKQLLGPYFDQMVTRQATSPHGGSPRTLIDDGRLVIESSGRLRHFTGRAYLPAEVPAGVLPQDIR